MTDGDKSLMYIQQLVDETIILKIFHDNNTSSDPCDKDKHKVFKGELNLDVDTDKQKVVMGI